MELQLFESVYKAYVWDTIEEEWDNIADFLMAYHPVNKKEEAMMFNLCKFKDDSEPGRKWHYDSNGNKQSTFDEIPNTVRRCKTNVYELYGIVLDVDMNMDIPTAMAKVSEYEYVLYTTFRHTLTKNKFRIIMPFSQPLLAKDIRGRQKALKEAFPGVDDASFTVSQSFYLHSGKEDNIAYHNKGVMIDPYSYEEEIIPDYVPITQTSTDIEKQHIFENGDDLRNVTEYKPWQSIVTALKVGGFSLGEVIGIFGQQHKTASGNVYSVTHEYNKIVPSSGGVTMGTVRHYISKKMNIEEVKMKKFQQKMIKLKEKSNERSKTM
jgi:hypothetical protein